jgi:dihydrofolate reductase
MRISLIVAVDQEGGIGYRGDLPWHLPADLQHFKKLTMGHHLIMGRKTYQSIGRPLPGRTMIVLTRRPEFEAEGCLIAHSLQEGLALAESRGEDQVFVIGGASVFEEALPLADDLYLTLVHAAVEADTYFPGFNASQWRIESERFHPPDEDNPHPQTYFHLIRKSDDE